mmetsp:Transcript_188/g.600  ORF Transcript_188/g.600 Transcript_188/m.600 type:complete len:293 (+) Transcript_188:2210-3088(+)
MMHTRLLRSPRTINGQTRPMRRYHITRVTNHGVFQRHTSADRWMGLFIERRKLEQAFFAEGWRHHLQADRERGGGGSEADGQREGGTARQAHDGRQTEPFGIEGEGHAADATWVPNPVVEGRYGSAGQQDEVHTVTEEQLVQLADKMAVLISRPSSVLRGRLEAVSSVPQHLWLHQISVFVSQHNGRLPLRLLLEDLAPQCPEDLRHLTDARQLTLSHLDALPLHPIDRLPTDTHNLRVHLHQIAEGSHPQDFPRQLLGPVSEVTQEPACSCAGMMKAELAPPFRASHAVEE